jgi:hypothetical protein
MRFDCHSVQTVVLCYIFNWIRDEIYPGIKNMTCLLHVVCSWISGCACSSGADQDLAWSLHALRYVQMAHDRVPCGGHNGCKRKRSANQIEARGGTVEPMASRYDFVEVPIERQSRKLERHETSANNCPSGGREPLAKTHEVIITSPSQ